MKIVVFFALFLCCGLEAAHLQLSVNAEHAILMNAQTGAILFEKEAFVQTYPASTTKIATALYALHERKAALHEVVTVKKEALATITPQAKRDSNYRNPPYWLESDGSHIGLKSGEELSLHDLLHGVLISSANDASNAVAMHIGKGSIPKFMEGLNDYLTTIGCQNTTFYNPHGLHHPAHKTTAYDLAMMAKKGLESPEFRKIVGLARYSCPKTNLEYERTLVQTNLLLRHGSYYYPKAIGIKTGGTQAAGKNLVAAAEDENRCVIAVVLGCKSRAEVYQDVIKLFEAAFNEPKMRRTLLVSGEQKFTRKVKGARGMLRTTLKEPLVYDFYPSEEKQVTAWLAWTLPQLPIKEGSAVGVVSVVNKENPQQVLQTTTLYAAADVKRALWPWILGGIGVLLLLLFLKRLVGKR